MPRPRQISDEGLELLGQVVIARARIPSDKELSIRCRVSQSRIRQLLHEIRERLKQNKPIVSRPTSALSDAELDELALQVHSKTFAGESR